MPRKKISCVNGNGEKLQPSEPNGIKLEAFIFDALPIANNTMVYEAVRKREFSPVKNADGIDSPASAQMHLQEEFCRWLTNRDIAVPRDSNGELKCKIEISPRSFVNEQDFQNADLKRLSIKPGDSVYIE